MRCKSGVHFVVYLGTHPQSLRGTTPKRRAQYYSKQDVRYATLATRTCINLMSPRIPSSSRCGDPHYLHCDGYPVWRLPDIKLRHWHPLWGQSSRSLGEFEGLVIKINMLSTDEFVRLLVRARTNLHQVDASACQSKTEFPSKTAPSGQIGTPTARNETSRLRGSKKLLRADQPVRRLLSGRVRERVCFCRGLVHVNGSLIKGRQKERHMRCTAPSLIHSR
jgi:hypothetical protein